MKNKEESEEERQERLADEYFEKTGIYRASFSMNFSISYEDLQQDLVKNTEGKMIKPVLNKNNN
ncbi:hypothetical protein [Pedobacter metabolipauper]|nr:hypothetical protein [Pedobacter metabolipauper]